MTKIAIIGASYLQLPLVNRVKELGFETHCFAWEDGAVCKEVADYFYPISILNREDILKRCELIGINGILTIATDMAVPTVCYVAEKLNLVSNSFNSALVCTNKALMRARLADSDVKNPKYIEISSVEDGLPTHLSYPMIVKPVDRSGSRGVAKVSNPDELVSAINIAIHESFANKAIVEEFVEGTEVSVECISWKGQHYLLSITDKITTGAPHFVELAHHQPSLLSSDIQQRLQNDTYKALDALDIKFGASHSEFKITDDDEIFVIEVGARMGGDFIGSHLVELSTGYDFLKGVINVAVNKFEQPNRLLYKHSGIFFLSEHTANLLPYFKKVNSFDVIKEVLKTKLKKIKNSNDRSGYLIYQNKERVNLPK